MNFNRLFHRRARRPDGSGRGGTGRRALSFRAVLIASVGSIAIAAAATLLIAGIGFDRDDGVSDSPRAERASSAPGEPDAREGDGAAGSSVPELPAPYVGNYAPPFTLTDLEGEQVSLAELHESGKVVLLNFWATWCPPCKEEMPELQRVHDTMGDKVAIVGIDVGEPPGDVRSYVEEYGYDFGFLLDPDLDVTQEYRMPVRFIPTSYFIDPDGVIRSVFVGQMDEAAIVERTEAAAARRSVEG